MKNSRSPILSFVASFVLFLACGAPAHPVEFSEYEHLRCVEARDYQGCLKTQRQASVQRSFTAFDGKASEAGEKSYEFSALQGDSECKITLYQNVADICGQLVGRTAIKAWSSYRIESLIGICIKDSENSVSFLAPDGTEKATSFTFINIKSIRDFDNKFISWTRMLPNRTEGNC